VTRRIALLSVHTCPLAALGGKETGGMNVYVRELARELAQLDLDVDVFTRSQDPAIPRVVPLSPRARVVHVVAGPQKPLSRMATLRHLGSFADGVAAWTQAAGVAYALIHGHYWLSGIVALDLGRRWRVPVAQMFHTLGAVKNAVDAREREPAERLEAETRVAQAADRIVAATPVERADLAWSLGADPGRIRVIPCGVDLDVFRPGDGREARRRLSLDSEPVLLFVGRLTPIKGLETLLHAVGRRRAAGAGRMRLLIVGGDRDERLDGERTRLQRLSAELGIGSWVDFRGPQAQDALPDYYRAADLCLIPSRHESFGMVALEAMACGATVVASRVGGLETTVQDGATGVLVPEGDIDALATVIAGLLGDTARRWLLGRRAAERARRFAWPHVARAVLDLYGELVPTLRPARRPGPLDRLGPTAVPTTCAP
jgi:D-inositol-3-phosphate glycosyltransferase